jgi:hypothetical protein
MDAQYYGRGARAGLQPNAHLTRAFVVGVALALFGGCARAESVWPKVALPQDANTYSIGEQITVNGLPMRMQGFVSAAKPAQVAQWFRQSLGKPLVENTLASKLILGRAQGEHYISIQLEPIGRGTRGLVAVSHLNAGYENRAATQAASERLLSRLPSGSRLISQMASNDGGKLATYVLVSNTYNEDLNRDRVASMLREDGLTLEREAVVGDQAGRQQPGVKANGRTLFFKGAGKEAMAVISRDEAGQTMVVLNTITFMERFK